MSDARIPSSPPAARTLLGHPRGLFLLFFVEMWERFSYYGMRALLVLYLVQSNTGVNPGRGWSDSDASTLYGWYTGLVYLTPIFGGFIADRLIGTHRSLVVGSVQIIFGHLALAISGMGALAHDQAGVAIFVMGLTLLIIGTGHFKPTASVMVGQLYALDDPRRDGAFTIFYMGINLGAFLTIYVCGKIGEQYSWHWGFGAAAVGMGIGLITYLLGRSVLPSTQVNEVTDGRSRRSALLLAGGLLLAAIVGMLSFIGFFSWFVHAFAVLMGGATGALITAAMVMGIVMWAIWFVLRQERAQRGPTACILIFIIFNAFFWLAYEQAGSSLNLFAAQRTNRWISIPGFSSWEVPATYFQSINPFLIILLSPLFARLWSWLGYRRLNPSQPVKIALALILVGLGYLFMVAGSMQALNGSKAAMIWLVATYTLHTVGELCISPTGLAFVTRAAPVRYGSVLMGIWFLSNAVANLLSGLLAAQTDGIEQGTIDLFWYRWFKLGGQADFYLLFVLSSFLAAGVILLLTPLLKRMLKNLE